MSAAFPHNPSAHPGAPPRPWSAPVNAAMAARAEAAARAVPELHSDRLLLRAPRLGDFALWQEISCSARAIHVGGPFSPEEAWDDFCRLVAVWLLRGHGVWALETRQGGALIGFVLIGFEPGDQEPELGFLLAQEAEGQGYAHEAARAVLCYAFGALGLDRLVSYIDPANTRARALARRLGAQLEGMLEGAEIWAHRKEGAAP